MEPPHPRVKAVEPVAAPAAALQRNRAEPGVFAGQREAEAVGKPELGLLAPRAEPGELRVEEVVQPPGLIGRSGVEEIPGLRQHGSVEKPDELVGFIESELLVDQRETLPGVEGDRGAAFAAVGEDRAVFDDGADRAFFADGDSRFADRQQGIEIGGSEPFAAGTPDSGDGAGDGTGQGSRPLSPRRNPQRKLPVFEKIFRFAERQPDRIVDGGRGGVEFQVELFMRSDRDRQKSAPGILL